VQVHRQRQSRSESGRSTSSARGVVAELKSFGPYIVLVTADLANRRQGASVLRSIWRSIRRRLVDAEPDELPGADVFVVIYSAMSGQPFPVRPGA